MKAKWIAASLLACTVAGTAMAQEKSEKAAKEQKEESIIIRKKGDNKKKLTIVVDGDKITVNGKPLEDFKGGDIEVLKGDENEYAFITPKIRGIIAPNPPLMPGGIKMFGNNFMHHGNKALLGVTYETGKKGARVNEVSKESAAEKAGLKKGDIITKVGDTKIENSNDLYEAIGSYKPEDKVAITYLRDGKENTTTATLGKNKNASVLRWKEDGAFNFQMPERPLLEGMGFYHKPRLGVQIQDIENSAGVKILAVGDDTPAAKAGLKKGDIITSIDGKAIKNLDELRSRMNDITEGDSFNIQYNRDGKSQAARIQFPKRLKTANL